ncbi:MAG: hypothetical protein NC102_05970 [Clostridium sp.]|nr:hypothetical protein [Clostridium sp.]
MITSKRGLKGYIGELNDAVVQYVLPSAVLAEIITNEQADEILCQMAELHSEAVKRINISFDKKEEAFETEAAFKKAKRAYFRQAYGKALDEYKAGLNKVLETINKASKK